MCRSVRGDERDARCAARRPRPTACWCLVRRAHAPARHWQARCGRDVVFVLLRSAQARGALGPRGRKPRALGHGRSGASPSARGVVRHARPRATRRQHQPCVPPCPARRPGACSRCQWCRAGTRCAPWRPRMTHRPPWPPRGRRSAGPQTRSARVGRQSMRSRRSGSGRRCPRTTRTSSRRRACCHRSRGWWFWAARTWRACGAGAHAAAPRPSFRRAPLPRRRGHSLSQPIVAARRRGSC